MKLPLLEAFSPQKLVAALDQYRFRIMGGFLVLLAVIFCLMPILLQVEIPAVVPYHLHSELLADYARDPRSIVFPAPQLSLVGDALSDQGLPGAESWEATLVVMVQTPAPTITPPNIPGGASTPTPAQFTIQPSPTQVMPIATSTLVVLLTITLPPSATPTARLETPTTTTRPGSSPTPTPTRPRTTQPAGTQPAPTVTLPFDPTATELPPTDPPPTNTPRPPTPRPTSPPPTDPPPTPRPYPYP